MQNSIILAKMLSVYFIVLGIALLLNRKFYQNAIIDLFNNKSLYMLANILALIVGILIISFHNVWVKDWPVVITLVGALSLIKGAVRLLAPKWGVNWRKRIIDDNSYYMICSLVVIIIGVYLGYMAFV